MKTRTLQLSKKVKALMIVALLCVVTGMTKVANAQSTWEQTQNYLFYLVYADYQFCEQHMPEREDLKFDAVRRNLLLSNEQYPELYLWGDPPGPVTSGIIGLAKNETEGFQVFFHEQEKERNLRIEVSPFLNAQNEELQHTLYYEEFFHVMSVEIEDVNNDSLTEALVPYNSDQIKQTSVGHNRVFYVELKSTKNQTPGEYNSTITAYDGDEVIDTRTVKAKVWNFALPENHYSEVVMGLYNRNSGYFATSSLFTLNGIGVDGDGNVAESDLDEAKRILDGYQNCLLEHGVSTYEIPRWLMQDDPKAAELTMADPRRKVFEIPVHWSDLNGMSFNASAQSVIKQYKDIVYDNDFLKDKAFFYPMDEPKWNNQEIVNRFNTVCAALSESWPGYHAVIPFYSEYYSTIEGFEGKIDILCPNQATFDPQYGVSAADDRLLDFSTRNHTWRYQGDGQCGGVYCFISAISPVGTMRRILFWQQYRFNSDGFLNWNCAYLPSNWIKKTLPDYVGTGNGDGILLYPGTMFGQDAATPVVSLRLKQLAAGIDDYDYFCLAKEFLGEDYANTRLQDVFWSSNPQHISYYINRQCGLYLPTNCKWMNNGRYRIGEALNALGNVEHNWSEWQTAVLPDETHAGLEIRTCECGAQESREKAFYYNFLGTEDNNWENLANWDGAPTTLPTIGEAVFISHDCEINADQTASSVKVKNGFNLTIKSGATLNSRLMSTEENAQVIIEDGAQLYTVSEGVHATVKKNIAPHGDGDGWYFISTSLASDVAPGTSNGMVPSEGSYDLYYFDQSEDQQWQNYKAVSFNLENGKGYLYANSEEEVSLAFTGTTNGDAAKEVSLAYDADSYLAGWNLVGNPYPCKVYSNKSYYTLNEDGNAIEPQIVSTSTAIEPCTGIMVKTPESGESVTFSKTAPAAISNNGNLQIIVTQDNTIMDKAVVSFNEGDGLEKFVLREGGVRLSILQKGGDYAVACAEKQGEMPLNFKVTEKGTYALTVSPEQVEMEYLHLIDHSTGTDVDLLQTSVYTFHASGQEPEARFIITFKVMTE